MVPPHEEERLETGEGYDRGGPFRFFFFFLAIMGQTLDSEVLLSISFKYLVG